MKINKISFLLLLTISLLISCDRDNEPADLFGKSPEARVSETIAEYKRILAAPENGWVGYYSSNNDRGGYLLLFDFEDGMVRIKSEALDFLHVPIKDEKVTYKVGVKQHPELVFESHCIFNVWHDAVLPDVGLLGGGEFQFTFEKITENEIVLKSKTDIRDITYLTLRPARAIDWNLDGLPEMDAKLFAVSPSKPIVSQKLVGAGVDKFAELDITNRMLYVEQEDGKVASLRFGVTRRGIALLDTLTLNGEHITEFSFVEGNDNTIVSDSPNRLRLTNVANPEVRYIKPQFAAELKALAPGAFVTNTWVYTKSPDLKQITRLETFGKEYSDYFGIEFLTNLRDVDFRGAFNVDIKVDFSKNKELRNIVMMFNAKLTKLVIEDLPKLETVVLTINESMTDVVLRSLPKLREVHSHLNHKTNFSMDLRNLPALQIVRAQQNGWKSLDITGCSALEELSVNAGNSFPDESVDESAPTMVDINGLSATAMPKLTKLWVPITAKCGANVWKFYNDTKAAGRTVDMMYGHSLITREAHPQYIYKSDTCH